MTYKDKVNETSLNKKMPFDKAFSSSSDVPFERRTKGVITREKILNAAIEELALNGIKGTTHRVIATRANIQLSLTTYYFKDIQELIHHAFMLNANNILLRRERIFEKVFLLLETFKKSDLRKIDIKNILFLQLVDITSTFVLKSVKEEPSSIAVQQIMFTEVQFNPYLRQISHEYEASLLQPYKRVCSYFNKVDPEVDAGIFHTVISQLQYKMLSHRENNFEVELSEETINKMIHWIMKMKR